MYTQFFHPKKSHQKYHHSKRDDLSLTLIPIKKGVYPGRLTTGTYSHHPWKERNMMTKTKPPRALWFQPLIFQGACVNVQGVNVHPSIPVFSPSKLSPKLRLLTHDPGKRQHTSSHVAYPRDRSTWMCANSWKKRSPSLPLMVQVIRRFENKTSWGKGR